MDYDEHKKSLSNAFDDLNFDNVSRETSPNEIYATEIIQPKKEFTFDLSTQNIESEGEENNSNEKEKEDNIRKFYEGDDDDDIEKTKTLF